VTVAGSTLPRLSVVVIGRNEGALLERCLSSVHAMNYPAEKVELIYVDSASTDGSREIGARHGAGVIAIGGEPLTAARAREMGWRLSSAPFLMFLDGDCALDPDFVSCSISEFRDPQVAAVWGHITERDPKASLFHRVHEIRWQGSPLGPGLLRGGNHLFRRSALEAAGGFNAAFVSAENAELGRRLHACGYTVLHTSVPMVVHDVVMSRWSEYWRRGMRDGYGYAQFLHRSPGGLRFWEHSDLRERVGDQILALLLLVGVVSAIALWARAAIAYCLLAVTGLVALKAWRARNKTARLSHRLLYGLHSQITSIAALCGSLWYVSDCVGGALARSGTGRGPMKGIQG